VHLLNYSSWKFHHHAAGQLLSGQPVRYGKGRRNGPSITYIITPAGPLSSSQQGGPPCWASPLAFGHIGYDCGALLVRRRENTLCCPNFGQQTATACTNCPKQILNKPTTRLYNSLRYKRYVSNVKYKCICMLL
jgi:hypothetical protein